MNTLHKNSTLDIHQADLKGQSLRIGIVLARFNPQIGEGLLSHCVTTLKTLGVIEEDIVIVSVSGALEIPFALQKFAQLESFDALIALGAVIRGDTYHFEMVSNEMASGIMRVSLDSGLPIANGVLTCDTDDQALIRIAEKGSECAKIAIEMANLAQDLSPNFDEDDLNDTEANNTDDSETDVYTSH